MMVGDLQTGYIVVPHSAELHAELDARCKKTGREPSEWVRSFNLTGIALAAMRSKKRDGSAQDSAAPLQN